MKTNVQTLCTMRIIGSYTFQPLWVSGQTNWGQFVFFGGGVEFRNIFVWTGVGTASVSIKFIIQKKKNVDVHVEY